MRSLWTPQTRCWHQTVFRGVCVKVHQFDRHAMPPKHGTGKGARNLLCEAPSGLFKQMSPVPFSRNGDYPDSSGLRPTLFVGGVLYAGSSCWYVPPIRGTVKVGWSVNVGSRSPGAGGASGCPACWCWAERMGMTQRGQPVAQGRTTTDLVFTRFSCWETRLGRGRRQWLRCAGPAAAGQSPAW